MFNLRLPSTPLEELLDAAPKLLDQVPEGPLSPKLAAARKQLEAARKAPPSQAKEVAAALAAALPQFNLCRFQATPELTGYVNAFNKAEECVVYVQSPKEARGDGHARGQRRARLHPLEASRGRRRGVHPLAAMVSGAEHLPLVPVEANGEEGKAGKRKRRGRRLRPFAVSIFQPVVDQRELIEAALAGDVRGFKVQECGPEQP